MIKKLATVFSIFVSIFAVLFGVFALNTLNLFTNPVSAYQITVNASFDTIIKTQNGQVETKNSPINVQTDCRDGYTLQIEGPADANLYLNGDASNNEVGKFVGPVNTASSLANQPNTYGYNLISGQINQIFTPLTSATVTLKGLNDTESPSADINDTTNIYWGVYAGLTLDAGTYTMPNNGAATYIITTSPTCVNYYNVSFDPNGGSGAQMPTQQITENTPTTLTKNTYISSNDQDGFIGWNTQPDGSGTHYADEQEVTLSGPDQNITLYAQWNCPASKICYFDNGASSPTTMDNQSATSNTATTLWPTNFQRKGYGFAGWAETPTPTTTDTIYGPQQTLTATEIGDLTTKGKKLYAVWIEAKDTIQNWTGCPKLTQATYLNGTVTANLSSVTALLDTRDGEAYAVAKLPDGKCWMIENLRLGSNTTITLTPNDTSINANLTFPASTTSFSNSYNTINSIRQNAINKLNTVANMTGTNANIHSYGVYYTWPAAIGSTSAYSSGSVSTSICPRGWTLPLGNTTSSGSFGALDVSIGGTGSTQNVSSAVFNRWRSYPNNFVYSGGYYTSRYSYRGSGAVYWTRTLYSEDYGFNLLIDTGSSRILPGDAHDVKYNGETIRCIARSDYYTIIFDKNGGSGDMADQTAFVGTGVTLNANTFTAPAGKSFKEWNTKPDGTGDSYTNEQEVTDLTTAGETITLYAQWGEPTPLEQISTMQEMTSGICSATPVGTEAVLEDTRDGKTYSVAKLKDGNCWMTEDLDHDIDATKTYTPADTDISSNWTPDVSTINIQGLNVGESVAGWVGAFGDNGLASADPGEAYWDGSTNRHSRIGNYYNWTAALAVNDSGAYSNGTETDPSQNPQTSICPKGWRLPIIANEITGHVDEFKELNRLYNNGVNSTDSGLIASPLYFTRGGAIDQSSELQGVGDAGSYWSSTAGGPMYVFNTAYYFNHDASYNDSYSSNIAYGYNIRCVARNDYTVSFNANSGSGNMADQIIARGISAKLKANEFSAPSGFVFDGWNTEANGSGTSYANEATVTNLADAGGTITLYAQWKDTRTGFDRIMTMQDMTSAICAEAAVGDTKRLRDTRDDKYYNIRKMEDGKCWMVQNLALTSPNGYTLTPADSDVSSEFVIEPGVINSTGETWRDEYEDKKHIFDAGNTWIEPTSAGSNANVKTTGTPPNEGQYIGAYYSYYTATAGTGPRSLESGDAPSSICPKGWKLPTSGTTTSDWAGLTGALVGITSNTSSASAQSFALQNAPAYLGMFGLFDAGSMGVLNQGSETYYMSSSASGMDSFYALRLGPKRIDPGNMAGVKRSGNVVRCVAR